MISVRGSGGNRKIVIPTSIKVTTPPTKTTYTAGEQLDLTGMVVTAEYSDGTSEDVTSECTFTPTAGTVLYENIDKINIAWVWEGQVGYSTTQAITVNRVLRSIAITTPPTKTAYNKNETLDLTGMVVTATFTSEQTVAVTGYTTSPSGGVLCGSRNRCWTKAELTFRPSGKAIKAGKDMHLSVIHLGRSRTWIVSLVSYFYRILYPERSGDECRNNNCPKRAAGAA